MAIDLVLYQPDIAQNTGTLLRFGACFGVAVHVIHPTGFPFSRASLRRAGLDYLDLVELFEHNSFAAFEEYRQQAGRRLVLGTTKAANGAYDFAYRGDDLIMVGRESAGVPDEVADRADARVRLPMRENLRSINVALAGALLIGEAKRQTDQFKDLK
ncbi:tRNA (cytidine(34)-2'-O)-methyltransferase [Devosia pacifica]|nr:TrmH family RNA methyltransferase [Devosia pacifica]